MKGDDLRVNALYVISFLIHVAWCFVVSIGYPFQIVMNIVEPMAKGYSLLGFNWTGAGSAIVALGICSSLVLNILRRGIEGVLLGWPRYSSHTKHTFLRSWFRAVVYLALAFFLVGVLGEKYRMTSGLIGISMIAIGTYIVGLIANIFDDAISATVVMLGKEKK